MAYPPPPRHLGDKKRYYYNSNPNRRYGNPYAKNKYSKPFNNPNMINNNSLYSKDEHIPNASSPIGYTTNNTSLSNTTRNFSSQNLDTSQYTSFISERPRQSRYSGATTADTQNSSSNVKTKPTISRYNTDSELSTHGKNFSSNYRNITNNTNITSKQHIHAPYNETDLNRSSTPSKSRFEKNKHSSATSLSTYINNSNSNTSGNSTSSNISMKNSSIISPSAVSSRYNNTTYSTPNTSSYHPYPNASNNKYAGSRYRPRSAESSVNSIPLASRDTYSATPPPATTTNNNYYYSKGEFPHTTSHYSTEYPSIYDNKNTPNYVSKSNNQWHGNRSVSGTMYHSNYSHENVSTVKNDINKTVNEEVGLNRDTKSVTPSLSRYNPNVGPSETSKNSENPKMELPKEAISKSETLDTVTSIADSPNIKNEKCDPSKKVNHSSLINSVTQTTREVEKRVSVDHKRIDLSKKGSNLDISHPHHTNTTKNEIQVEKKFNSEADLTMEFEEKNERPQLKSMWTSSDLNLPSLLDEQPKEGQYTPTNQESDEDIADGEIIQPPSETHYEYVCDSKLLRPSVETLKSFVDTKEPLPEPLEPLQEYIFPMKETELKLWILKNRTRSKIIQDQKYLLKIPISNLKEYPFMTSNYKRYLSTVKPILIKTLISMKINDIVKSLLIKKNANKLKLEWDEESKKLYEITAELRKKEIEYKKAQKEKNKEYEQNERYSNQSTQLPDQSGTSFIRRRNRADFVDDAEMENVLLQIDPEYKHFQAAAIIPPLQLNHIERNVIKFQNVNNLVTDKDKWASRILLDKEDNFTENEHTLFVEGYLMHPKKFGKISHHMGGLRTPEECVLHYYRTKKRVNYKELLLQKSKKRKENIAKRRKKKEKEHEGKSLKIVSSPKFDKQQDSVIGISEFVSEKITNNSESILESPSLEKEIAKVKEKTVISNAHTEDHIDSIKNNSSSQDDIPSNSTPIDTSVSGNKESQNDDMKDKPENIGDKDVIAIATTAMNSITEIPTLEKSDTIYETEDVTTESTSTPPKNKEPQVENKKRTYSNSTLSESSGDKRVQETVDGSTPAMNNNTDTNADASNETEHVGRQTNTKNSEAPGKSNDTLGKKKHKYMSDHKTSYWSVKEAQIFPELLRRYGSQWSLISENLTTKSTTMVRNYYQRNAAQNGWKTIVEEADFRKDRENNKSLQQTQFMLHQNGNNNNNSPSSTNNTQLPTISNGIPTQQKPAMLFFDKPTSSAPSIVPARKPSVFSEFNKDIFSNTPLDKLPKPRLPSILFPKTKHSTTEPSDSVVRNEGKDSLYPLVPQRNIGISPQGTTTTMTQLPHLSSSIFDFMGGNTDKRDEATPPERYNTSGNQTTAMIEPSLSKDISTFNNNILHGMTNETVPRNSDTILTTDIRPNSITALLNPISQHTRHYGTRILASSSANESMSRTTLSSTRTLIPPIQNTTTNYVNQTTPITLQPITKQVGSNIQSTSTSTVAQMQNQIPDFTKDPLAALAAVASAPETLASILPEFKGK